VTAGLDELYRQHMNDIYLYLYKLSGNRHTAEDLTQETYFRAFRFLDAYHGGKVRPWLFKVAYHAFIDWHRKKARRKEIPLDTQPETVSSFSSDPERSILDQELHEKFEALAGELPHKQHQSLLLLYYHQLTYDEIAGVLDIPLADVKISIYRGRQKLRQLWRKDNDEPTNR